MCFRNETTKKIKKRRRELPDGLQDAHDFSGAIARIGRIWTIALEKQMGFCRPSGTSCRRELLRNTVPIYFFVSGQQEKNGAASGMTFYVTPTFFRRQSSIFFISGRPAPKKYGRHMKSHAAPGAAQIFMEASYFLKYSETGAFLFRIWAIF